MKKPKSAVLFISVTLIFTFASPLFPQDSSPLSWRWGVQSAYYFPNNQGLDYSGGLYLPSYSIAEQPSSFAPLGSDEGRGLGNGWGNMEIQSWVEAVKTYPFLQGESPLTKGNNLQIQGKMDLSPATADLNLSLLLTPAAFFVIEQGNHLGTGWNAGLANGLGLNSDGSGNPDKKSFPGIVYRGWFSGKFQFDLAAVLPEPTEWTHVVLSAEAKFLYQDFSGAGGDEPWQYQADEGENFNGWQFRTSTVLGYMIPDLPVNFAGFMIETERRLGDIADSSTMADGGWGSDFTKVRLGPLFNWRINGENSLTVLIQCHNGVLYDEDTLYYNYFMNRRSTDDSYWYFERIALSYTMRL